MTSSCEAEIWQSYNALDPKVRALANEKFALWLENPTHPGLHFKAVKGTSDWWSVRIGLEYRALCIRQENHCQWFFMGNHRDYDSLVP